MSAGAGAGQFQSSNSPSAQQAGAKQIVRGIDLKSIAPLRSVAKVLGGFRIDGTEYTARTLANTPITLFEPWPWFRQTSAASKAALENNPDRDIFYNCHGYTFGLSGVVVNGQTKSFWIGDPADVEKLVNEALTPAVIDANGSLSAGPNPQQNKFVFVYYQGTKIIHTCIARGVISIVSNGGTFQFDPSTPVFTKNGIQTLQGGAASVNLKSVDAEYPQTTSVKMFHFNAVAVPTP